MKVSLRFGFLAALMAAPMGSAQAGVDYGALKSGLWNAVGIWTPSGVPSADDSVFIGGNYPAGAAQSATVSLSQDTAARNVYLGFNSNGQGTLDLGNSRLSVVDTLSIGASGGTTGLITRDTGSFSARNVDVGNGNSLAFGSGDQAQNVRLFGGTQASTTETGNMKNNVEVNSGSRLDLGANLVLSGDLNGAGDVYANGHSIQVNSLGMGVGALTLHDRGGITVGRAGSFSSGLTVFGIDPNLTSADHVGTLTMVNGATTTFAQDATVGELRLNAGTQASTTETGNVTNNVEVNSGARLDLGANLVLSGDLSGAGDVYANGHSMQVNSLGMGVGALTLHNRGGITVGRAGSFSSGLTVFGVDPNLTAADHIGTLTMANGATTTFAQDATVGELRLNAGTQASTTHQGNVTGRVELNGGRLDLGADLVLSGELNVQGELRANGHDINVQTLTLLNSNLLDPGKINVLDIQVFFNESLEISELVVNRTLSFWPGAFFRITQAPDAITGLSLMNVGGLELSSPSVLDLTFGNASPGTNWIFRWANPGNGGDHLSVLQAMIGDGRLRVHSDFGYGLSSHDGFTYITSLQTVPEPSSLVTMAIGLGLGAFAFRRRAHRRRTGTQGSDAQSMVC